MKTFILIISIAVVTLAACVNRDKQQSNLIGDGQMPAVTTDNKGTIHLVYGTGDSLMYCNSSDNGTSFTSPFLISVLPHLAASHTRGPQIAAAAGNLVVTACTDDGNIFSFSKTVSGNWLSNGKVNDRDTVAKENLMALSADGNNAFAVWLDLRDKHNKIVGARSPDGGKTWSKNQLIYASPDTTVCECCKPSVLVKDNTVYVMFRNWLDGNRDLYLVESTDAGYSFGPAQKLGIESWALNGCPMDGGGLTVSNTGKLTTVWNRKGFVYTCEPGKPEKLLGKGRSCAVKTVNNKNIYTWVEGGHIIVMLPSGVRNDLGNGQLPLLQPINNEQILCVWQDEKKIHKSVIDL